MCSVRPVPDLRHLAGEDIPEGVRAFYKVNEVDLFQFDRPYHRGQKDENNEFKVKCLRKTVFIRKSIAFVKKTVHGFC